ncbi:MerR family transcriptional regulator [Bdellovibrio sp. HCB2-146]|uniref:MerR family transcriptional regulator n=1 Tax=Bdellovibrio sp. HCB2-146 TaxID=3394362 RepID=UPI0039BD50F7
MAKEEAFSIRQVIELTGISEFTLRGWESRYNAFKPKRSATGRRHYSLQDIQKARLLQELVNRGYKISEIARLKLSDLEKILPLQEPTGSPKLPDSGSSRSGFIYEILDLALLFQWDQIRDLLNKKRKANKPDTYVLDHLVPLAGEMGILVAEGQFSVAQEHILSALIKDQLILTRSESKKAKSKSRLVLTTPEGDLHDMGIMIGSSLGSYLGLHTLFLGPSTPKKDLCETCIRYNSTHLLLASTVSEQEGAKESLYSFVNFLDRNLPQEITFLIAGRNSQGLHLKLKRKVQFISSMPEFWTVLKSLK